MQDPSHNRVFQYLVYFVNQLMLNRFFWTPNFESRKSMSWKNVWDHSDVCPLDPDFTTVEQNVLEQAIPFISLMLIVESRTKNATPFHLVIFVQSLLTQFAFREAELQAAAGRLNGTSPLYPLYFFQNTFTDTAKDTQLIYQIG